jgi:hypothetical protein
MTGVEMWVLDKIADLVFDAVKAGVVQPLAEQRKIKNRVRAATAEALQPLIDYLDMEKIPREKQERLIETCERSLRPLTEQSERLFQGSLDGEKIFEQLYPREGRPKNLPEVIREDGTEDIYSLLIPCVADLICKVPAAVKDWESLSVKETLKRLDDLGAQQRQAAEHQLEVFKATKRIEERTQRIDATTQQTSATVEEIARRLKSEPSRPVQPSRAPKAEQEDLRLQQTAYERAKKVLEILEAQIAGYTSLTVPAHLVIQRDEQMKKVAELEARRKAESERGQAEEDEGEDG